MGEITEVKCHLVKTGLSTRMFLLMLVTWLASVSFLSGVVLSPWSTLYSLEGSH